MSEGSAVAVTTIDGTCSAFYILGGRDGNTIQAKCLRFSNFSDTVSEMKHMNVKRAYHYATTVDQKIFAFCGITEDGQMTKHCEKYFIETNKWMNIADFPAEPLSKAAVCLWQQFILLSGGRNSKGVSNKVWAYDSSNDKWHEWPALMQARHSHNMVAYRGRLFALAGNTGIIEEYDPVSKTFNVIMDTKINILNAATLVTDTSITLSWSTVDNKTAKLTFYPESNEVAEYDQPTTYSLPPNICMCVFLQVI